MPRDRLAVLGAFCLIAGGLLAYALVYRAPPRARANTMFAYDQQTFSKTRSISTSQIQLHSVAFRSEGGAIAVDWYDSSLIPIGARSPLYAVLTIDGQTVATSLVSSPAGLATGGPATLRWAGTLPAGLHRFQISLGHISAGGAEAPYVPAGRVGVDSLVLSQEPGTG